MAIGLGIVGVLGIFMIVSIISKKRVKTSEDYYLMGRSATWWMFASTLSASYVSLSTFIGGVGASWDWGPMPYLLFFTSSLTFGWIIAVVIIGLRMRKMGSTSISDFYRQRFGDTSKSLFTGISATLAAIIFFYLLVQIQGGGIVIAKIFNMPLAFGIAIMVTILALTLASSGMYSVVWTDVVGVILFIIVAVVILPGTIAAIGGLDTGLTSISANGGWSATGSSGLSMPYFIGYALAWLSIIGGSPHLINRSLIVDTPKSIGKGSFVAYVITMAVTLIVFLASSMLITVIEPGSMSQDEISAFASINIWPTMVGVILIGGAMAAAFTTASTQALTVSQGFVDIVRFALKPNMDDKKLKNMTMWISVFVLVFVGAFAAQQFWLIVIASSLAGVIASLGFFPTLILALYWKRLTVKSVKIMLWSSIPIGIFMIVTNSVWGWFAPFPTIYSYPIGFGGLIIISLLTKQTAEEKSGYEFMKEKGFARVPGKIKKSDYITIFSGLAIMFVIFVALINMLDII